MFIIIEDLHQFIDHCLISLDPCFDIDRFQISLILFVFFLNISSVQVNYEMLSSLLFIKFMNRYQNKENYVHNQSKLISHWILFSNFKNKRNNTNVQCNGRPLASIQITICQLQYILAYHWSFVFFWTLYAVSNKQNNQNKKIT